MRKTRKHVEGNRRAPWHSERRPSHGVSSGDLPSRYRPLRASIWQAMSLDDRRHHPERHSGADSYPQRPAAPIAELLGLDASDRESGIWHDDFLWLGSRLRPIYGNRIAIASDPPAYLVSFPDNLAVSVTCPPDGGHTQRARMSAPVIELQRLVAGVFEFAMRENVELALARLSVIDGWLVAEHELAFCGACIPALEASVSAVASTATRLRREIAGAFAFDVA